MSVMLSPAIPVVLDPQNADGALDEEYGKQVHQELRLSLPVFAPMGRMQCDHDLGHRAHDRVGL